LFTTERMRAERPNKISSGERMGTVLLRSCAMLPSPFRLAPCAVADPRARSRFATAVPTKAMVCRLGNWSWSATRPRPSWKALQHARLWNEATYAGIRASLQAPRPQPALTVNPEGTVRSVIVPDQGASGSRGCSIDLFKGGDSVPQAVVDKNIRMVIVHAVNTTQPGRPLLYKGARWKSHRGSVALHPFQFGVCPSNSPLLLRRRAIEVVLVS
jgi:hypothetical protein